MKTSDEVRKNIPVPIAYLQPALAVTLSKLEKVDEACGLAPSALEADYPRAHRCRSLEGFVEAFSKLFSSNLKTDDITSKKRPCTSCKELATRTSGDGTEQYLGRKPKRR